MTKDKILTMLLESGYKDLPTVRLAYQGFDVERFANLVAAAERQSLAQPTVINMENFVGSGKPVVMDMFSHTRELDSLRNTIQALSEANEAWSTKVKSLKTTLAPEQWTPEDIAYRPGGLAQPEQEPIGHIYTIAGVQHCTIEKVMPDGPLYTSPPKHQPLTNEQIDSMWQNTDTGDSELDAREFARAIEAKLKEKNT